MFVCLSVCLRAALARLARLGCKQGAPFLGDPLRLHLRCCQLRPLRVSCKVFERLSFSFQLKLHLQVVVVVVVAVGVGVGVT